MPYKTPVKMKTLLNSLTLVLHGHTIAFYINYHELSLDTYILESQSGFMVTALDSGVSALGLNPGQGHWVVFMGKIPNSHSASPHAGV